LYWRRDDAGNWQRRVFDAWGAVQPRNAMVHVNWFEAEAYCNWAGRRLPTEAEWEFAASTSPGGGAKRYFPWGDDAPTPQQASLGMRQGDTVDVFDRSAGDSAWGIRQMIGNVWEWTTDNFEPYPGFSPDPYKEYSAPWFDTHKTLRGGAWPTRARLLRNTWRSFYTPDRRDVWAGFRTCALAS
jgi:iron(II)-dependent oxidoreductase